MTTDMTQADVKRDALRQKIEANERRIAERTLGEQAAEAAQAAVDYTRANPLTVIGGAVAVGLAIGLMTQPGQRVAAKAATGAASAATGAAKGAAGKVGGVANSAAGAAAETVKNAAKDRTSAVWALVSDALVGYAIKVIDDALGGPNSGKDAIEDLGDSAATKARSLRREASYLAGNAAEKGRTATRRTKRRAERAVRDLTDRVKH